MTTQPQPTAANPVTSEELDEAVKLAHEWGHLKRLPRTGWLHAGIKYPESVAEHSHRTAMLAWMIAGLAEPSWLFRVVAAKAQVSRGARRASVYYLTAAGGA